jgi:phosphatidylserine/phosphatidylglycerophosphate/cardiolipin synthase-like enzyme
MLALSLFFAGTANPGSRDWSEMRPSIRTIRGFIGIAFVTGLAVLALRSTGQGTTHPEHVESFSPNSVSVYFSPKGGCTEAVEKELDHAEKSIRVQAYSFTSAPIAKALVDAKRRGVDVEVILDKSQRSERYSSADFVAHAGIPTFIDAAHAIAHNKIIIVDAEVVLTGSFNFTKAAEEKNAENLLVIHDKALAAKYRENWEIHQRHSEEYSGR